MTQPTAGDATAPRGSILERTARGAGWVFAWRLATRLLGFVSTLVLVRLLSPADFGLVALATVFATTIEVVLILGVEDQIIRTPNPQPSLYHTAFTLNLLRAAFIGLLVVLAAAPGARFFEAPRLEDVLIALGVLTALSGLTNIGVVDFRRELKFDKEFKLQLVPRVVSVPVTIAAAFLVPGEWALMAGIAVNRLGRVVMSYSMHPFRPRISLAAWRDLVGVSLWTWAIAVCAVLRDRADTVVVGRMLGPAPVGIYSAGSEIASLPITELVDPIARACMPGFAATLREGVNLEATFHRIIGLALLLGLPAGIGVSLVATDLVFLAYGPAWMEAVPVVTLIGLISAITPIGSISQAMLGAMTQLRTVLWIFFVTMILRAAALLIGVSQYGIAGAAGAVAFSILCEQVLLVVASMRYLRAPVAPLVACVWRPAVAAAVMAALLWSLGLGWGPDPAQAGAAARDLLLAIPIGVACYAVVLGALWVLSGRPAGSGEHDLLVVASRVLRSVMQRVRPAAIAAKADARG